MYMAGMMGALFGAAVFQAVATVAKMPISGTHAIVGGVVSVTIIGAGPDCLNWDFTHGLGTFPTARRHFKSNRTFVRSFEQHFEISRHHFRGYCSVVGDLARVVRTDRSGHLRPDRQSHTGRRGPTPDRCINLNPTLRKP